VENIPLQAERHSGSRQRLFGLPPESVFSFRPECCSASQRNGVQLQTGIAFTFDRIPQNGDSCSSSCPKYLRNLADRTRIEYTASALLHSRTNAGDESRIGCSQARAKTEYKWRMESVAHALILGEHKANVNSPGTLRFLAIGDAQRYSVGRAPALDGQSRPFLWKTPSVDSQGAESRYSRRAQAVRSNP
jgi:hypothetical protein